MYELLVVDAVGLIGGRAQAPPAVGLVVLVVALEPAHLAVAFERQHVRGDAIEEPAIVADHDGTTGERLESGLERFPGCAVVISHDRWFLDRIATHILAFEGDSHAEWFEGNFQDYEADRKRRLGTDADQPHRIKYKPIRT